MEGQLDAPILSLPNELLFMILWLVASIDGPEQTALRRVYQDVLQLPYRYATKLSYGHAPQLALVCKRFYGVIIDYIYSNMFIDLRHFTIGSRAHISFEQLWRSYQENPILPGVCRTLFLGYGDLPEHPSITTDSLVSQFTAVRSFTLHGLCPSDAPWNLLTLACTHFDQLKELSLGSTIIGYELELSRVFTTLGGLPTTSLRNLRRLHIDGTDWEEYDWTKFKVNQVTLPSMSGAHISIPQKFAGTAPFTKLELSNFLQGANALRALIEWPKYLAEFKLEFTITDEIPDEGLESWTLAGIQNILEPHRQTLRSLKVNAINRDTLEGFDLRSFESLEELGLGIQLTGNHKRHSDDRDRALYSALPLGLRAFHWDLTWSSHPLDDGLQDFSQWEEEWLRRFVLTARAQGCPLKEIYIAFAPDSWSTTNDPVLGAYPWDRMDQLGVELEIKVHYNTPTVEPEEYAEIVEEYRRGISQT
ncbi:hypothetical protein N7456_006418 [Penicillium angulare]|uniref:F-box domain-containing protein n=1 Tax=Penicillium angulare TaxID=116970 RepID=A0A9W9KC64_9EURO|nr:hypothetical protein N7456_006418 [Penicillium angulare]